MTDHSSSLFDEEDLEDILTDLPALINIRKLTAKVCRINWFSAVGDPVDRDLKSLCQSYLDELGFPDIPIVPVETWEDAAALAENPEFDSLAWDTEEQLRASLTDAALAQIDEEALGVALQHISDRVRPVIEDTLQDAGALWDIEDDELLIAATGAALQACHVAGLAVIGEAEEDHPAFDKLEIFARGRWPVSITGATFNLF